MSKATFGFNKSVEFITQTVESYTVFQYVTSTCEKKSYISVIAFSAIECNFLFEIINDFVFASDVCALVKFMSCFYIRPSPIMATPIKVPPQLNNFLFHM